MAKDPQIHPLKRIRLHLGLNQEQLAARLRTSRRSILRWERGESEPLVSQRARILVGLHDVPHDLLRPLAAILDSPLDPLAGGGIRAAKEALDASLHAAAEEADVSARALRLALTAVLARAAELELSLDQTRAALAPASKTKT